MSENKRITLGILAHVDAGKTTLSEALLYRTGEIIKPGRVDHGDTFLDDTEIERNRGITVFSRQAGFRAGSTDVTMIDTPGHIDFAAEMERALSVIDYALLVVSGSEGVQAHTRTLYKMLCERGIPVCVFVNKMDIAVRPKEDIISEMNTELGGVMKADPGHGGGMVDFSSIAACHADGSDGAGKPSDASASGTDEGSFTESFIDDITLYSPELAEQYLEQGSLTDRDIAEAVRRREIVPCIFGSALRAEGIGGLLEVLDRFTLEPEHGEEFAAKVYKIADAEDGSRLAFARITGGTLRVRDTVRGRHAGGRRLGQGQTGAEAPVLSGEEAEASFDWESKVTQIRIYSGSKFVTADEAGPGMVAALTGLPEARPGDGLGAESPAEDTEIKAFMVYTVIGPEGMDPYLVMKDMEKLAQEDPALSVRWLQESGETEIRLMGQVQLEVLTRLIKDRFGYGVTFGSGKVLYLETVTDTFEGVGHFEPLRHYAEVHLIVEPGARGSGIVISSITPEDELARNWQRLIMTHIDEKEHRGVLTGAPLTDVRITLGVGRAHDKHTSGGDFREAVYRAVRNALMQARAAGKTVLLEPWFEYEMVLPSQAVGRAMTDIRQMGGTQDGLDQNGDVSRISGRVPASAIAGYQQVLTGYTAGMGRLACTPAGYDLCHDQDKVIEESGYEPERDVDNPADSVFVSHGASDIVKWDKVPEHMHLGSVLRRVRSAGQSDGYGYRGPDILRGPGTGILSGDDKERKAAAEKELKEIFERTYGPAKADRRKDARETRYGRGRGKDARSGGDEWDFEKDPEQKARDEARNQEIREKHTRSGAQGSSGSGGRGGTSGRKGSEAEKPLVVIDGYNLIHADEYLTALAAIDMGAARDQVLERLCNYAAYKGHELVVVFDAYNVSGGEGYEEDHLGVRVLYTSENEPADIRIGLITGSVKGRQIYVVSSDVLVQQDSFEHGALRISSKEFMSMLTLAEQEIRASLGR